MGDRGTRGTIDATSTMRMTALAGGSDRQWTGRIWVEGLTVGSGRAEREGG